jgi:small GTP-binding protein
MTSAAPVPTFKCCFVGSPGVGKTDLIVSLARRASPTGDPLPVHDWYVYVQVEVDGQDITLQLCDPANREPFHCIPRAYIMRAAGVILVFNIADRSTFEDLDDWLNRVQALCDPTAVVFLLVGNHPDVGRDRVVTVTEAEEYAQRHQFLYVETSPMDGTTLWNVFLTFATRIYRQATKPTDPIAPTAEAKKSDGRCF